MQTAQEKVGDVTVVHVPGTELVAANADEFRKQLHDTVHTDARLVIDLEAINFVDSTGLSALLWCLKRIRASGGDLRLCGMAREVRAMFELVRMHRVFSIDGTRDEALAAFQG